MSQPSHQAASRISAMWKAHKAQAERLAHHPGEQPIWIGADYSRGPDLSVEVEYTIGEDRNIELRRIRELPPLTKLQQAD